MTAGRHAQHCILFNVLISVTSGKANALYKKEKESVTEKKARGPLTTLWTQESRAVICALKIRRESVDKDYLWRLPHTHPLTPLPASVVRKSLQGDFLSSLLVVDKGVFKETYVLAGKTTACIQHHILVYVNTSRIQLTRSLKLYRLYSQ